LRRTHIPFCPSEVDPCRSSSKVFHPQRLPFNVSLVSFDCLFDRDLVSPSLSSLILFPPLSDLNARQVGLRATHFVYPLGYSSPALMIFILCFCVCGREGPRLPHSTSPFTCRNTVIRPSDSGSSVNTLLPRCLFFVWYF